MTRTLRSWCGTLLLLTGLTAVSACREVSAPTLGPPYLAIVALIDGPSDALKGTKVTYRIRELSGTVGFDSTVSVAVSDTIILSVVPASYVAELTGVPAICNIRDGTTQGIQVPENSNTSLIRYNLRCRAPLQVTVAADGFAVDSELVYRLTPASGPAITGILHLKRPAKPNPITADSSLADTLVFAQLPNGPSRFELGAVAANCATINSGGEDRSFDADSVGGVRLDFRIACSEEPNRPSIVSVRGSYHDGAGAMVLVATDPNRDLERYTWDLTDCRRKSLLTGGYRLRRGVSVERTAGQDTVTIVAGYEVGLPDATLTGKCFAVWVADERGNTSLVREVPLGGIGGSAPVATAFNARFNGTRTLATTLIAQDADNDYVGFFGAVRLRDGTLFSTDGQPDIGFYNRVGYLGQVVPDVPLLTPPLTYENFFAVILYLVDAAGNFVRLEDGDLFQ
jgi:hypothetical protein